MRLDGTGPRARTGEDAARLEHRLAFCCLAPWPGLPQRYDCCNGTTVDS